MTAWSDWAARWLFDYYAAASVVLAVAAIAGCLVRAPAARVALGRAALIGLAILVVLCAASVWPRVAVLPALNEAAAIARPSPAAWPAATSLPPIAQQPAAPIGAPKLDIDRAAASRDSQAIRRTATAASRRAQFRFADARPWTVVAFAIGAALLLSRQLWGAIQVRRLGRGASHAPEYAINELRRIAGPGVRLPRLLVSPAIDTAGVWGLLRPTIALPERAICSGLAVGPILAHEWAHIRRGDLWALALVRGLQTLLYAHPLYWIVRRRLRDDQELVADASAADLWGRCEYAAALIGWARFQSRPRLRANGVLWISERRTLLSRRISMLLDERIRLPLDCGRRWRLGSGLASLALVAGLSVFTLHATPDMLAAPPVKRPEKVAAKITRPATKASDAEHAEIAGVVTISGICRDEKQSPVAGCRVRLFRTELSDIAHLRPTGRVKMVQSFVGPVAGFSAGNYGTSMEDPESQRVLAETTTDAVGCFTFTGLVADPAWTEQRAFVLVVVQAAGKGTQCDRAMLARRIDRSPVVEPLQFTLPEAANLRGRVVDEEGKPVAGAVVSCPDACGLAKPQPGVMCAVTDADGRYEIADLPPFDAADLPPQVLDLGVLVRTSAAVSIEHADYALQVAEYERLPAVVAAALMRPAMLTGQVVDDESTQPAPKATVYWTHERGFTGSTLTDQNGRYSAAGLPPGKYALRAWRSDRLDTTREVELHSGANSADLRLVGGAFIQGIVIDEATGKPPLDFGGMQMSVHAMLPGEKPSEARAGYVQRDGTFSMTVRPGKNSLVFFHPRWGLIDEARWRVTGVEAAKGQTVKVELRVASQRAIQGAPQAAAFALPKKPLGGKVLVEYLKGAEFVQLQTETIDGREAVTEIALGAPYEFDFDALAPQLAWLYQNLLANFNEFPELRSLTLYAPQGCDEALKSLRKLKKLESLFFANASDATDAGAAHLTAMLNLKELALVGPRLGDGALHEIARLPRLGSLMIGGAFSDEGLLQLRGSTRLKSLYIAAMPGAKLTDRGLGSLAELTSLEEFGLGQVDDEAPGRWDITDAGLRSLAALSGLKSLSLQSEKITDAGLVHLGSLKNLKNLELVRCSVTEAGIAELKQALPNLVVKLVGEEASGKVESKGD